MLEGMFMSSRTSTSNHPKREKHEEDDQAGLIPGLPDDLAQICLSFVPPAVLYSVCRSWRRLIFSPSFPPYLSIYALLSFSDSFCHLGNQKSKTRLAFYSFDPVTAAWSLLPSPPLNPSLHLEIRHPSFLSCILPIQSAAVSGHLLVLAATDRNLRPALSHPLIFDPLSSEWWLGPQICTPRRWCAVGSTRGAVYMASGVGADYNAEVARSAERWDLKKDMGWEKATPLKDARFSREAVDAVGLRGKLCMVNVKGDAAKQGVVYNVNKNEWEEMPKGLLSGWKGPTATLEEEVMYVVLESGVLREYNPDADSWVEVIRSEHLKGVTQIAAGGGKVCAICAGGLRITVVDVVNKPARIWVVTPPPSARVVTVHVLPRMNPFTASAEL